MYKKYSKLRKGTPFLLLVVLLTFTLNPISVKGSWSEDFSDSNNSEWDLYATDWGRSDNVIQIVEHGLYVEDGILKSDNNANPKSLIYQSACRAYDFVLRSWSGDVYNAPGWGWAFTIGRDIDWTQNLTSAAKDFPAYYLIIGHSDMRWEYLPDSSVSDAEVNQNVNFDKNVTTTGWHSYVIQFEETEFKFYLDGDLFLTHPVSHLDRSTSFDTYNTVCSVGPQTSPNMYDNITASEELIDPQIVTSTPTSSSTSTTTSSTTTTSNSTVSSPSDSNGDDAGFTILLFGGGSMIAISAIYTLNRYFKKKD
ncbi:MAG: hypothetical protein GPJ54_16715 [Candidatus Heimdallarchaeota archaeon]|nr:hypothetical protein [Candidatus Heimdallarchaeota archaeon]